MVKCLKNLASFYVPDPHTSPGARRVLFMFCLPKGRLVSKTRNLFEKGDAGTS